MVFRGLDLVGNSMIGFQEEDRVFLVWVPVGPSS